MVLYSDIVKKRNSIIYEDELKKNRESCDKIKHKLYRDLNICTTMTQNYVEQYILDYSNNIINNWGLNKYIPELYNVCPYYKSLIEKIIYNITNMFYSINYSKISTIGYDKNQNYDIQYHHIITIQFYTQNVRNDIINNNINENNIKYPIEVHYLSSNNFDDLDIINLNELKPKCNSIKIRNLSYSQQIIYEWFIDMIHNKIMPHFIIYNLKQI